MSIVRVGSTVPYAVGWDHIFGDRPGNSSKLGSRKAGKKTKARKPAAKTAAKTNAVPKAKAAKGKTIGRKPARAKRKK